MVADERVGEEQLDSGRASHRARIALEREERPTGRDRDARAFVLDGDGEPVVRRERGDSHRAAARRRLDRVGQEKRHERYRGGASGRYRARGWGHHHRDAARVGEALELLRRSHRVARVDRRELLVRVQIAEARERPEPCRDHRRAALKRRIGDRLAEGDDLGAEVGSELAREAEERNEAVVRLVAERRGRRHRRVGPREHRGELAGVRLSLLLRRGELAAETVHLLLLFVRVAGQLEHELARAELDLAAVTGGHPVQPCVFHPRGHARVGAERNGHADDVTRAAHVREGARLGRPARGRHAHAHEDLEHAAELDLVAEHLRPAPRRDVDARSGREIEEQRGEIDPSAPTVRRAAGVERRQRTHRVVERVERRGHLFRGGKRRALGFRGSEARHPASQRVGRASCLLRQQPRELLPGEAVARHGAIMPEVCSLTERESARKVGRVRRVVSLVVCSAFAACSHGSDLAALPSAPADAGVDASDASSDAAPDADASVDGGALGKPCSSDVDCDDAVPCTRDACDEGAGRCRHTADAALCDDGVFCNGVERCDLHLGCALGPPISCADNDPCTIDVCVEATHSCAYAPRDADQDGDPDAHCGGGDCNDQNPLVSSLHPEICGNGVDDNCDGNVDEMPCAQPAYDTCFDPLALPGPGAYTLSTAGAMLDYGASCGVQQTTTARDVVAYLEIPPGADRRLDVKAAVPSGSVAVAIATSCGVPQTELACAKSQTATNGGQVAHARAWDVPPGQAWIVVYADADTNALVNVSLADAGLPPTNETCGTASAIVPDAPITVPLVGVAADVPTKCGYAGPDLVYRLDLAEPHDVRAFASTVDGLGLAIVSIRTEPCAMIDAEAGCAQGNPASAFARSVGPGTISFVVKATVATDVSLLVTLAPPTKAPPDETCASSPALAPNVDRSIDLTNHTDDVTVCASGYVDAAYALSVAAPSDVLALLHLSSGDVGALSLEHPPCSAKSDVVACHAQGTSPIRVAAHGLAAGDYRLVAESQNGEPATLTPLVRPASATTFVAFSQTCATALDIPETGGSFQGNTANASAKYSAGCDQGGVGPFGAPEQILRLVLTEKRRVVFDMAGSGYPTLLDVRKGPSCPGEELPKACTIGPGAGRSFLDLTLAAGTYFVQIDGYAGASGAWLLDVFTAPP